MPHSGSTAESNVPDTMRALALSEHCNPSEYGLASIPTPQITRPYEILVRVHAASVNPIDVKMAGATGKLIMKAKFPYTVGYDLAGTVVDVGSSVKTIKPGDEVYSRIPQVYRGSIAQYCLTDDASTSLKPKNLSWVEAAALPLAGLTALQALDMGERFCEGGLRGKTVLVPGGLSGTGQFAVQLAKNVFGAGKVVTTLSTGKIPMIKGLLGESSPDVCVDYTKNNVVDDIGKHSVDFMFDTQRYTTSALSVMRKGGQIVSISTIPNGTSFKRKNKDVPMWVEYGMNFFDWILTNWARWKGVGYRYLGRAEDLERMKKWVEEGKVKVIVGSTVKLEDIRGIKDGCQKILDGKGGVGKFVVEID